MSDDPALADFIQSLADTRTTLSCAACRKPFNKPVKYLTCLHTVCASHTGKKGNKFCAVCRADVRGSDTVPDHDLQEVCGALLQLEAIFKKANPPVKNKQNAIPEQVIPVKKQIRQSSNTESPKTILEKKNVKGETALHVACRSLKMQKILDLLEQGANPNTKDNAGWTPLHEVAQKGSLEAVKLLLNHKALSDIPGLDNETPLHEAVRYGHIEIAKELVKYGADLYAKNIKGDTPFSLADEKFKSVLVEASDDIVQSQTENIKEISMIQMSDFENMHVFCSLPYKTVVQKLKKLAKKHSINIETEFSDKVTHLIVETENDNTTTCTIDLLRAIVNGVWILNTDWITKSTEECLEKFDDHEIAGFSNMTFDGHKKARFSRYKKLPGLFDGCHFYLHDIRKGYEISKSLIISKAALDKIIEDAGGKVLKRVPNPESIPQSEKTVPYHAHTGSKLAKCSHYIIYPHIFEPTYNMEHLKALPIGWLMDCIYKYEICDP